MDYLFYMPPPDLTGVWEGGKAETEFKEGVSIFKFERVGDKAAFSICDNPTAHRAALGGLRRGWMSIVTQSETFAPASSQGIKNEKPGKAELLPDGNWKVVDKARISFLD
jgi:hypothetical protein